jgi:subtilisin family serine protease
MALCGWRFFSVLLALLGVGCGDGAPPDVQAFSDDPLSIKQGYMLGLGVPGAWSRQRGSVVVAVVDNGVDLAHPDIAPQLWNNPLEQPNGIDDDGDGRADDVHGWNFLDGNADVDVASEGADASSHGTSVAGIIAARTDNGVGIAGLCPGCQLMILKARDFQVAHNVMAHLDEAIDYAVDHGARVINVSDGVPLGSVPADVAMRVEAAVTRAEQKGVLVVVSAGNDGKAPIRWPAKIPGVLAVAAVDWEGRPTLWTSFGEDVDIAAPGVFIDATVPGAAYDYFEGTSASSPVAAALAALLFSAHPEWSPAEVVTRMKETAAPAVLEDRPALAGMLGAGVVRFGEAL